MSCVSTPTATQFSTVVSSSVSTSFSAQVTTLAGTTSTALTTSCLSSAVISASENSTDTAVGSCVASTVITSTTVIGGEVSTAQVPVEVTNFFTSSVPTNTLFAPCSTDGSDTTTSPTTTSPTTTTDRPTTPTSSPTTDTAASFTTEFSQSLTTVLTTPTITLTSSQDTTLNNGAVTQVVVTLTSVLPPTSSVLSSPVPIATTQVKNGSSDSNMGAIIGGSVGGFVGLLAIVGALWFFCRRRRNWDDIFEKDYEEYSGSKPLAPARGRMLDLEDEPVDPAEANTEPRPYVYGLVGSANTVAPPSLNAGLAPIASVNERSLTNHNHTASTTPLMLNNGASASRPGSAVGDGGSGSGLSPSPSFTQSASGGRSGSPGPLGVAIPTAPAFSTSFPESPTSVAAPRGALFVANQLGPESPPGSPTPGSPASSGSAGGNNNRSSMSTVAGPSFAGAMTSAVGGAPPSSYASEKQRLQRNDSVSSRSVYSQASWAQTAPVGKHPGTPRRASGVVVHTDAGRAEPPDQPPAYQG